MLYDATLYCILNGISEEGVYDMRPDTFKMVYQSLKREEARKDVKLLYIVNQACNGTKDSIPEFEATVLGAWLGSGDTRKNKGGLSKFRAVMSGKNLKKGSVR